MFGKKRRELERRITALEDAYRNIVDRLNAREADEKKAPEGDPRIYQIAKGERWAKRG